MAYTLLLDGCEVGHVETEEDAVQWCLHYNGDHDPTYEETQYS